MRTSFAQTSAAQTCAAQSAATRNSATDLFEAYRIAASLRSAHLTDANPGVDLFDIFGKANLSSTNLKSAALPVSSARLVSEIEVAKSLEDEHLPLEAAVFVAQMSDLVYQYRKPVLTALKAEGCAHAEFFDRLETQAVGFVYADYAFLVFRGTEPGSLKDWQTDLRLWPRGGRPRRHIGFWNAWGRIRPEVESWLTALELEPKRLVLSGHSLGGALAILAAFDLADFTPIRAVLTFGAPRVGGRGFRQAYHQTPASPSKRQYRNLQDATWRFIHKTDLVTMIPPPLFYRHVGQPRPTVGYSRSALSQPSNAAAG